MATAPHHLAAQAGVDTLKDGGNAIEAAVTVAATLAVVYPHMTGIGGDGFWLIADADGRTLAIDACGAAARAADMTFYRGLNSIPWRGSAAANTVAGTISGWQEALGMAPRRLSLARLLRDAIQHAERGVAITRGGAEIATAKSSELRIQPGAYAGIFEPSGRPLLEGEILVQPALASTLRELAGEGLDSFYRGALAEKLGADLRELGSPITLDDLQSHHAQVVRPLSTHTDDAELFNMMPPTQGVASLLILALFDRLEASEAESFAHVHGLIEATKQAFIYRDNHVGDPAYMNVSVQDLLSDSAALGAMAARIDPGKALNWQQPQSGGDTTWFATADSDGRVVSAIQSTYFEFGSGLVLPQAGIIWQNRGCSFRLAADGWNALRPGRKPFHTLNPPMARFADGRVMAYGTMGGEGQPQTQAAIFSRYARYGVNLQEAITRPRWLLGRTWGETSTGLKIEDRFSPELYSKLRTAGHMVELIAPFSSTMGHAGAIVRHHSGLLEGATDPRSDGQVACW